MVAGVAARLSAHLAQADEYERLWHRRAQGILRQRRDELALLDQIQALRQRVLELEAQNEALAAFDRTVAHELKNALGRIVGYAEVLTEKDAAVSGEQLDGCLGVIARDGRKLSNMIDALLLLCGASAGEVEVEPLDMASIVSVALERLAPMIEDYQAEVTVPDAWPAALGYGPWVEEVWVNLVSNAVKYGGMPPRVALGASPSSIPPNGAQDLSESSCHGTQQLIQNGTNGRVWEANSLVSQFVVVSVGANQTFRESSGEEKGGRRIRFWVRDNGPGLLPKQQALLFRPFTRLRQGRANGNGLGLSIVRQIVEKLGGQVGVESDGVPGRGSVFYFDLLQADG
jgi:signal transduction histidine kinase